MVELMIKMKALLPGSILSGVLVVATVMERLYRLNSARRDYKNAGKSSANTQGSTGGAITVAEAYDILNLKPGATKQDVHVAYRSLMQKNHPDLGGSEYLAKRVNEARDLLLKHIKEG